MTGQVFPLKLMVSFLPIFLLIFFLIGFFNIPPDTYFYNTLPLPFFPPGFHYKNGDSHLFPLRIFHFLPIPTQSPPVSVVPGEYILMLDKFYNLESHSYILESEIVRFLQSNSKCNTSSFSPSLVKHQHSHPLSHQHNQNHKHKSFPCDFMVIQLPTSISCSQEFLSFLDSSSPVVTSWVVQKRHELRRQILQEQQQQEQQLKPLFDMRTLSETSASRSSPISAGTLYQTPKFWANGFTGHHVKVAVFDTGIDKNHPHFIRADGSKVVVDRSIWTKDDSSSDQDLVGHGTFVASLLAGQHQGCPGIAPNIELYIFRVFSNQQTSFTSWFLDAFNYALHSEVDILNLSNGGPDFQDSPFVDKIVELTASNVFVISASGNDGPDYGTQLNPADQIDVLGVGSVTHHPSLSSDQLLQGLEKLFHQGDQAILEKLTVSPFSARGMTQWELPTGYGRVKPDVVTFGDRLMGSRPLNVLQANNLAESPSLISRIESTLQRWLSDSSASIISHSKSANFQNNQGKNIQLLSQRSYRNKYDTIDEVDPSCRTLSGTSFASPVAVGLSALMLSAVVPPDKSHFVLEKRAPWFNPSSLRQTIIDTAVPLPHNNIFEQGAGLLNPVAAIPAFRRYVPHASVFPHSLDLLSETNCNYYWPYCDQPLYHTRQPLNVNFTVLNGAALSSAIISQEESVDFGDSVRTFVGPRLIDANTHLSSDNSPLKANFSWSHGKNGGLYPYSGWFAAQFFVSEDVSTSQGVYHAISFTVKTKLDKKYYEWFQNLVQLGFYEDTAFSEWIQSTKTANTRNYFHPSSSTLYSVIRIPVSFNISPKPPRSKRILIDTFHSLKYPAAFIPPDEFIPNQRSSKLSMDWLGDHPHTNYNFLMRILRSHGYFYEVANFPLDCFDLSQYKTLMIIDSEDIFSQSEINHVYEQVTQGDLGLLVIPEWFDRGTMQHLRFFNPNSNSWWQPVTGGSNLVSINLLLAPYGILFGEGVYHGRFGLGLPSSEQFHPSEITTSSISVDDRPFKAIFASGAPIVRFPQKGRIVHTKLVDQGWSIRHPNQHEKEYMVPIIGLLDLGNDFPDPVKVDSLLHLLVENSVGSESSLIEHRKETDLDIIEEIESSSFGIQQEPFSHTMGIDKRNGGRIAVFGDSSCIDSQPSGPCFWLVRKLVDWVSGQKLDDALRFGFQHPHSVPDIFNTLPHNPSPLEFPDIPLAPMAVPPGPNEDPEFPFPPEKLLEISNTEKMKNLLPEEGKCMIVPGPTAFRWSFRNIQNHIHTQNESYYFVEKLALFQEEHEKPLFLIGFSALVILSLFIFFNKQVLWVAHFFKKYLVKKNVKESIPRSDSFAKTPISLTMNSALDSYSATPDTPPLIKRNLSYSHLSPTSSIFTGSPPPRRTSPFGRNSKSPTFPNDFMWR